MGLQMCVHKCINRGQKMQSDTFICHSPLIIILKHNNMLQIYCIIFDII